jgi:membrane protein implicated in regulation of membrane protease activity
MVVALTRTSSAVEKTLAFTNWSLLMPLPLIPVLILAGSAIAGGKGVYDSTSAVFRIKNAQRRYNRRRRSYEEAEERYKKKRSAAEQRLSDLGRVRLEALVTLGDAVTFLKKAKIKDRELTEKFDIAPQQLAQWQGASLQAIEALNGVARSAGAGILTASGAYGLVGLLGTASTGTAISTLTGVAASNATLAWLGGGALAAGGGGMALGTYVLGGLVFGPAVLVAGFFVSRKADEVETEVAREVAKMDVAEAEMDRQLAVLNAVVRRVDELEASTVEVHSTLRSLLERGDPTVIEDAYAVAKTAKALGQLLDVAILDRDGNLVA